MDKFNDWMLIANEETKKELETLNDDEIEERFHVDIQFGTAGIRGLMGAGTNRINDYVVRKVANGLGNFINSTSNQGKVVVGYDNRHNSRKFAESTAMVLANQGVKVYLFHNVAPTPLVSYVIRNLKATAGVMITASHNPKEYNGYKVYWKDGAQVSSHIAESIEKEITKVEIFDVKSLDDLSSGFNSGLIEFISDDVIDSYVNEVLDLQLSNDVDKDIVIVYTPLGGVGNEIVNRTLRSAGYTNVKTVSSQSEPDPNFTNVKSPNPEDEEAFDLAKLLGEEKNADVLIATDPDVDRVGLMVKDEMGYKHISGNMLGSLIVHYLLSQLHAKNKLTLNDKIAMTIVTDNLGEKIANEYEVEVIKTHVGFKNIYSIVEGWNNDENLIVGYEESFGVGIGSEIARDKDAVSASLIITEMVAYYKKQEKSLLDVYNELENKYGHHRENLLSIELSGIRGQKKIKEIVDFFRNEKMLTFAEGDILNKIDYLNDETGLQKANVIKYEYDNGIWFVIRPSGTEPKLKVYIYASSEGPEQSEKSLRKASSLLSEKIKQIVAKE